MSSITIAYKKTVSQPTKRLIEDPGNSARAVNRRSKNEHVRRVRFSDDRTLFYISLREFLYMREAQIHVEEPIISVQILVC